MFLVTAGAGPALAIDDRPTDPQHILQSGGRLSVDTLTLADRDLLTLSWRE